MRALNPVRHVQVRSRLKSFESLSSQLSAATLELTPTLGTTEFARRLTNRITEMFGARTAVLALNSEMGWEIASISGPARCWDEAIRARLARSVAEEMAVPSSGSRSGLGSDLLERELAEELGWHDVTLVRLIESETSSLMGVLCAADLGRELFSGERRSLEALASHAAVALENLRLFKRIEQSRKQWVEDFDAITDFVIVHDSAGHVLRLNRSLATALDVDLRKVAGVPIGKLRILGVKDQPPGSCPFCRDTETTHEESARSVGDRTYLVSASRIHGVPGEARTVHVFKDITEATALQAKLVHTEKMAALGQLISGVAHEVNNPLAAIIGFTDLLMENRTVPDAAKQELKIILREAKHTQTIVQNLLRFSREAPAQREPVQLNEVLQHTLRLRAYDLSNRGIDVVEQYEEDLPLTVADPHQLQQVFLNILNNAYDAVQEVERPAKIEVATRSGDGYSEVSISDNGPGVRDPQRVFEPFFTTKEVGKGTGLGLSICYGIIQAHGGEIFVKNNPGQIGCTFHVRLRSMFEDLEQAEQASTVAKPAEIESTIGKP
jgi:two-component system, NtrC family, sensor kinase